LTARAAAEATPGGTGSPTAGEPSGRSGPPRAVARATPWWFEYVVVVACVGVASFGGFGLVLALLGHYSAAPALLLGAAGTVVGTYLARPQRASYPSYRRTALPAAGACVVAAGTAAWNAVYVGHHVAVDRDPGVYVVAGKWIAEHGGLSVAALQPWAGSTVNAGSAGLYPQGGGHIEFQFAHLLPALLAEAENIGGDGLMFRVPVLLGALALCAVYAAGCRLLNRPWLVLAAVAALAVSLPQLSVTRDTYSEPATQLLVWGGIALLLRAYEERRLGVAFIAGVSIGATVMTRIDAIAYLIPLPLLAALGWLAARSVAQRRSLLRVYAAALVGIVPPVAIGVLDVQRRAGNYYHDLHGQVWKLYLGVILTTVIALAAILVWPRLGRFGGWLNVHRGRLSVTAVCVVAIGLTLAWSLRPAGPKATADRIVPGVLALQRAENLPLQPNRSYDEQSMVWLSWYLGPIALALAIAGLGILTYRAIRHGTSTAVTVLAMSGVLTAIYIWKPSITPEQIWAMRRYVPASLPLLLLAAVVAIDAVAVAGVAVLRNPAWSWRVAAIGGAALLAFPVGATLPVRQFQPEANYLPVVDHTCDTIGPDAAVLFPAHDYDAAVLEQTLRSWCDVPAAALPPTGTGAADLPAIATRMRAEGKTLWLVAADAKEITRMAPNLHPVLIGAGTSSRELEHTLSRPAENYATTRLLVYGVKVTP
jgi:hypothetical protein